MGRGPRPVAQREVERRQAYLAPLVKYLRANGYVIVEVLVAAVAEAVARGEYAPWSRDVVLDRVFKMRQGVMRTPPWLVAMCCLVIGKSVTEVMGDEWVSRFGADGRGGQEATPACASRRQRPWSRTGYSVADGVAAGVAAGGPADVAADDGEGHEREKSHAA